MIRSAIVLLIFLIANSGCETFEKSLKSLQPPRNFEGESVATAEESLGKPYKIRQTTDGSEIYYYDKQWLLVKNKIVIDEASFSYQTYRIFVNSFVDRDVEIDLSNKSFKVVSGSKDVPQNDLQFKDFAAALTSALFPLGMSNKKENPDYFILVSYGISDPQVEIQTTYVPVFNWVPGATYRTNGYVGNNSFSSTTTSNGYLQTTGYIPEETKHVNYKRYCVLSLYDAKTFTQKEPKLLSKTIFESTGSNGDLKPVIGVMFAKYKDYIDRRSDGRELLNISTSDPATRVFFDH